MYVFSEYFSMVSRRRRVHGQSFKYNVFSKYFFMVFRRHRAYWKSMESHRYNGLLFHSDQDGQNLWKIRGYTQYFGNTKISRRHRVYWQYIIIIINPSMIWRSWSMDNSLSTNTTHAGSIIYCKQIVYGYFWGHPPVLFERGSVSCTMYMWFCPRML